MFRLFIFIPVLLAAWNVSGSTSLNQQSVSYGQLSDLGSYISTTSVATSSPAKDSVVFVGDVLLGRNVERLSAQHGYDYPYRHLPRFSTSSYVWGNFEASVPEVHQPTPNFGFQFSVSTTSLPFLKEAGFTHLSLANNHSYDFGGGGYNNSRRILTEQGFSVWGDQSETPTTTLAQIQLGSTTVTVLSLYAVDRRPNIDTITDLLSQATTTDFTVAYIHWGTEYKRKATVFQQQLAKDLVAAGVDLIIGHHPHVVQEVDVISGVPVFYSLGNFIFDQYFSAEVQEGLMLELRFTAEEKNVSLVPVTSIGSRSAPRVMTTQEQADFLKELAGLNRNELQEQIKAGELRW